MGQMFGAQMQVSVEMTEVSNKTQFHGKQNSPPPLPPPGEVFTYWPMDYKN